MKKYIVGLLGFFLLTVSTLTFGYVPDKAVDKDVGLVIDVAHEQFTVVSNEIVYLTVSPILSDAYLFSYNEKTATLPLAPVLNTRVKPERVCHYSYSPISHYNLRC